MAASPRFKVYTESGEYIGAVKYASDAAVLVGVRMKGTVRDGHLKRDVVWHEGFEEFPAGGVLRRCRRGYPRARR